jgi:hypothetical protein
MDLIDNLDLLVGQEANNLPVCVQCSKSTGHVVRFNVKQNGVYIPYGNDSALAGDLYICPICNTEIIEGFGDLMEKPISTQTLESEYSILRGVRDNIVLIK